MKCFLQFLQTESLQDGAGTELESETGTVGTVLPETARGAGTVGNVFQEPKPEPSLSVKTICKQKRPFPERNRQNRKELSHARTATEPNRG